MDLCNSKLCCSKVNYIVFFYYLITLITLLNLADLLSFYRTPPPNFRIKMTMVAYINMIKAYCWLGCKACKYCALLFEKQKVQVSC